MALASLSQTGISQSTIRGPRGVFVPQTRTFEMLDDFITSSASATAGVSTWDATTPTGATIPHADGAGGGIALTNDGTDDDETMIELNNEFILPSTTKRLMFETRLKTNTIATAEIFAGLTVAGTGLGNGTATPQATDHVGFFTETDSAIDCGYSDGSTQTQVDTGSVLVADTYVTLGFEFGPHLAANTWKFYVDGDLATTQTATTIPNQEMTILLGCRNGTDSAHILTIQYVYLLIDL